MGSPIREGASAPATSQEEVAFSVTLGSDWLGRRKVKALTVEQGGDSVQRVKQQLAQLDLDRLCASAHKGTLNADAVRLTPEKKHWWNGLVRFIKNIFSPAASLQASFRGRINERGDVTPVSINFGDYVQYMGQLREGVPNGKGALDIDNTVYYGDFINGELDWNNAIEVVDLAAGTYFNGLWKEGAPDNGNGRIVDIDGNIYSGQFRDGELDGKGTLIKSDGSEFHGEFKQGDFLGIQERVTVKFPNGDKYEGRWENGVPGKGKWTFANGDTFVRGWGGGGAGGEERVKYTTGGVTYEGVFIKHLILSIGGVQSVVDIYQGEKCVEDKLNPMASKSVKCDFAIDTEKKKCVPIVKEETVTRPDGTIYHGVFEGDGEFVKDQERVTVKFPNGDTYEGQWANGAPGKGKWKFNNGDTFEGRWNKGCPGGKAVYVAKTATYIGEFSLALDRYGQHIYSFSGMKKVPDEKGGIPTLFDGLFKFNPKNKTFKQVGELKPHQRYHDYVGSKFAEPSHSPTSPHSDDERSGSYEMTSERLSSSTDSLDGSDVEMSSSTSTQPEASEKLAPPLLSEEEVRKTREKVYSDRISYTGDMVSGLPSGRGTLTVVEDGGAIRTFRGDFKDGKFTGKMVLKKGSGEVLENQAGEWTFDPDAGTCQPVASWGTMPLPDDCEYTGEIVAGQPIVIKRGYHGVLGRQTAPIQPEKKQLILSDGSKYDGETVNDLPHGKGTKTQTNGVAVKGLFENGEFVPNQLEAEILRPNGDYYRGRWFDGKPAGGTMRRTDEKGVVYEGKDRYGGEFLGQVKVTFPDGRIYEGTLGPDGKPGIGQLRLPNKRVYKGLLNPDFTPAKRPKKAMRRAVQEGDVVADTKVFRKRNYIGSDIGAPEGRENYIFSYSGELNERTERPYGHGTMTVTTKEGTPVATYAGEFDAYGFPDKGELILASGVKYTGPLTKSLEPQDEMGELQLPGGGVYSGPLDMNFKSTGTCTIRYEDGRVFSGTVNENYHPLQGKIFFPQVGNFDVTRGVITTLGTPYPGMGTFQGTIDPLTGEPAKGTMSIMRDGKIVAIFTGPFKNGSPDSEKGSLRLLSGGVVKGALDAHGLLVQTKGVRIEFPDDPLKSSFEGDLDDKFAPVGKQNVVTLKNGMTFIGSLNTNFEPVEGVEHKLHDSATGAMYTGPLSSSFEQMGKGQVMMQEGKVTEVKTKTQAALDAAAQAKEATQKALEDAKKLFGGWWSGGTKGT